MQRTTTPSPLYIHKKLSEIIKSAFVWRNKINYSLNRL